MPVLLLAILVTALVISGIILYKNKDPKASKEHRGVTSRQPPAHIFEFEESAIIAPPKYKVCPMCGSLWYHPNRDYIQNRCHYCDTELQKMDHKYDDWDYDRLEDEYVRQHIFPDPVKREKYKNMREILELELERAREEGRRFDAEQRIARGNTPKCPTCGSTNVEKLTSLDRGVSVSVLGPFSNKINKSFKCRNCKYTW